MEDLDALLADLQATNTSSTTSPLRSDSPPPPLPPPPSVEALDFNGRSEEDDSGPRDHSSSLNANLSELDSLLEDLSNPLGFGTATETPAPTKQLPVNSEPPPVSPATNAVSPAKISGRPAVGPKEVQEGRPSVEALLNELDSAVDQRQHSTVSHITPPTSQRPQMSYDVDAGDDLAFRTASSATKELDDLMASLSDFKVNAAVSAPAAGPGNVRHSGDYAKPQKGKAPGSVGKVSQLDSMLGSLQSDMTRQGVSTTKKGMCSACNKPIIGQVCTALGRTWHPEHFTCVACDVPLGTRNFFERDGKPFCEKDYHDQFAPRCAYCNGPILDSCETALGQTWHPDCFVCAQCGKPFGQGGFHERDGKAFCREDYYAMFAPRCGGCGQPIMDSYISALSAHWHPECFVCAECHQAFPGGSFFEHDGRPYCEMHYHAKRGTLCYSCQKPITGRCITAMHRKFHPEHFVCAFCLKQLNKGTFKEQNDKPYCHPCFIKLFG